MAGEIRSIRVGMTGEVKHVDIARPESDTSVSTGSSDKYVEKNMKKINDIRRREREAERHFIKVRSILSGKSDESVKTDKDIEADNKLKIPHTQTASTFDSQDERDNLFPKAAKDDMIDENPYCRHLRLMLFAGILVFVVIISATTPLATKASRSAVKDAEVYFTPTTSQAPTNGPSISFRPTGNPSPSPSERPSISPMPSKSPSVSPTDTQIPSAAPSPSPTETPTLSKIPTISPSTSPTISRAPTFPPISSNMDFKLRLYWESGFFWQEDWREEYYCAECVRCKERGRGDWDDHGCESYGTGDNSKCTENDMFWIRDCKERGNRFNVIQNRDENGRNRGYQLRIADTNLCMERINVHLVVQQCDLNNHEQLWVDWSNMGKFELRPLHMKDLTERQANCMSQHHHPKDGELLGMRNCRLNRIYETNWWEAY